MTTETQCPECGFRGGLESNRTVTDGNEVVIDGVRCPDCDTVFDDETTLQWENIDFPVWVEIEHHDDNYGLRRTFLRSVGMYDGDYNGEPKPREMKHCVFRVWFKVTEDGSVDGPYSSKNGKLL